MDPGCHQELAYQYYHNLITPYVLDEGQEFSQISSGQAFDRSVNDLIQHTQERIKITEIYLQNQ